ncbi:hypothetical protein Tco_0303236 [Tanacetum coccineum]
MLASTYVGPFEIIEKISPVAYRLRLPEELSSVHDTFHVSNLKKCLADANLHVPLDEIKIDKTLRFIEEPVEIMDREVRSLKRSKISLVKVRWNSKRGPEFTWEREDHMKSKYPQLFVDRAVEPSKEDHEGSFEVGLELLKKEKLFYPSFPKYEFWLKKKERVETKMSTHMSHDISQGLWTIIGAPGEASQSVDGTRQLIMLRGLDKLMERRKKIGVIQPERRLRQSEYTVLGIGQTRFLVKPWRRYAVSI